MYEPTDVRMEAYVDDLAVAVSGQRLGHRAFAAIITSRHGRQGGRPSKVTGARHHHNAGALQHSEIIPLRMVQSLAGKLYNAAVADDFEPILVRALGMHSRRPLAPSERVDVAVVSAFL